MKKFFNLIFPNKCAVCGNITEGAVCKACERKILKGAQRTIYPQNSKVISAYSFKVNGISSLIYKLKSRGNRNIASFLSDKMLKMFFEREKDAKIDFVTYVPVSKIKLMRYGFDHAKILAKEISNKLDVKLIAPPFKRVAVKSQKFKTGEQRIKRGSRLFALTNKKINGNVLIIDDVVTTGTTLKACKSLLRKAGAKKVYCLTAAFSDKV